MSAGGQPDDPAQRDLAWMGYHPRAAAPLIATALLATVLIMLGRWYELADRAGALAVFAMAWAVWPGLAVLLLYRTVTYTYRLTDRAVLVDFGMLSRPVAPVALADVVEVRSGGGWEPRLLGTGWVEVRTRDRAVRMPGVRHPAVFVAMIGAAVANAVKGPVATPPC